MQCHQWTLNQGLLALKANTILTELKGIFINAVSRCGYELTSYCSIPITYEYWVIAV